MSHLSAPTIDGLLADPLIQAMMRADHVDPVSLKQELQSAATRIAARPRALDLSGARVWMANETRRVAPALRLPQLFAACQARHCS